MKRDSPKKSIPKKVKSMLTQPIAQLAESALRSCKTLADVTKCRDNVNQWYAFGVLTDEQLEQLNFIADVITKKILEDDFHEENY